MGLNILHKRKLLGIEIKYETALLYSIYSLSILIPLLIGKPQLLVGSAINFLITYSTLKYGIKKTLPVLILPSITATALGVLFNGATIFLIYVMPYIMVSNYILSYFISKKRLLHYAVGIILKGSFLYISYYISNKLFGLPSIFVSSVNIQFITASIGVISALIFLKSLEKVK